MQQTLKTIGLSILLLFTSAPTIEAADVYVDVEDIFKLPLIGSGAVKPIPRQYSVQEILNMSMMDQEPKADSVVVYSPRKSDKINSLNAGNIEVNAGYDSDIQSVEEDRDEKDQREAGCLLVDPNASNLNQNQAHGQSQPNILNGLNGSEIEAQNEVNENPDEQELANDADINVDRDDSFEDDQGDKNHDVVEDENEDDGLGLADQGQMNILNSLDGVKIKAQQGYENEENLVGDKELGKSVKNLAKDVADLPVKINAALQKDNDLTALQLEQLERENDVLRQQIAAYNRNEDLKLEFNDAKNENERLKTKLEDLRKKKAKQKPSQLSEGTPYLLGAVIMSCVLYSLYCICSCVKQKLLA